jgi:hypothetical protein
VENREGFPQEQKPGGEGRPLGSLNPMARIAALTGQGVPPAATAPPAPAPATAPAPAADAAVASASAPVSPAAAPTASARPSLGRLAHVDAAHLWADDVAFATWLAANLDALTEVLSVRFQDGKMPHPEMSVVMASDASGATAVVVCELGEATDEGFGRLVRNVAASGAKHAVWVCGEPGDEYGASVSWLNRAVDARVSMVKVAAVTIGESAAAPMFELKVRTPRSDDEGVEATVPPADGSDAAGAPTTRRVDDWLDSVGARGEADQAG